MARGVSPTTDWLANVSALGFHCALEHRIGRLYEIAKDQDRRLHKKAHLVNYIHPQRMLLF